MHLLRPVDKCWQPCDWLPAAEADDFGEQLAQLRKRAAGLPDDLMVVLVGDMITEEALPTYMNMINTLDGVRDDSGADATPWAQWTRAWTAEEKRHGESLGRYLWLTGRVNGRSIDSTVQRLISSGMNPQTENNPYLGFIYTSFQERATKVRPCVCVCVCVHVCMWWLCACYIARAAVTDSSPCCYQVCHGNTARLAKQAGDEPLAKVRNVRIES